MADDTEAPWVYTLHYLQAQPRWRVTDCPLSVTVRPLWKHFNGCGISNGIGVAPDDDPVHFRA
jgi:hypothetical protein